LPLFLFPYEKATPRRFVQRALTGNGLGVGVQSDADR
jgi:hypothetical protein